MCKSTILSICFSFGYSTKLYELNHTVCSNFSLAPVTYHNAAAVVLIIIFVCSLFFWFVFSKFLRCLNLCFDIISYFKKIICCCWFRHIFLIFISLFAFWKSNYVYVRQFDIVSQLLETLLCFFLLFHVSIWAVNIVLSLSSMILSSVMSSSLMGLLKVFSICFTIF